MELRRLGPSDAGEVLTLQRAAYVSEAQIYGTPFLPPLTQTLAELAEELTHPALGLARDGRLVASVRWAVVDGVARIGRLIVAPDLQGQGLGTRLLRAAEEASGADAFELFTGKLSAGNIRLYEREGYAISREQTLSDGVELVFLEKRRRS